MDPKPEPASHLPTPGTGEWPARAADLVDQLVELLRSKTVRPLTLVTRAVVFGVIVLAATVVTVALVSIAIVRILTVYAFDGRVWLSDVVVGGLFVLVGLAAWTKRTDPNARPGA